MATPDLESRLRAACATLDRQLRSGLAACAEDIFARHPELASHPDAAVELVYTEYATREDLGERPDPQTFLDRFPALRDALRDQFQIHRLISSQPAAASRPIPTGVGPYRLIRELSRGPGGWVFQAQHRDLGRVVALKLLPVEAACGAGEAWASVKLEHPNIVRLYEIGTDPAGVYLVTEWVGGGTLAERLAGRPLPPLVAAELMDTLAQAAHYAHERGVIHRDIKPANVLLTENTRLEAKLTDFGLAATDGRVVEGFAGTPSYMAPEQARGESPIGPAVDVYALGAVLYECLTGRPPFRADSPLHTLEQVVNAEVVPPRRLNPRVPRDLETICLTCLQKNPTRRYASAGAFAEDLQRYRTGRPIAARPVGPLERGWKWACRRPAIAAMLGLLVMAAVALLAVGIWTNTRLRLARDAAERDAADLRHRYEAARRDLFTIQLTQANEWVQTDPGRALALLDDPVRCPPDLRDFAWGVIHHHCRQDVRTIPVADVPRHLAFSADGQLLQAGVAEDVQAWDIMTGEPQPPRGEIGSPLVVHEGSTVIIRSPHAEPVAVSLGFVPAKLAVSGDGRRLAAADTSRPPKLSVWDVETGTKLAESDKAHNLRITALAWSPDGQSLASGGLDRVIRVLTADELREVSTFRGHLDSVTLLAWAPDGRFLASASEDRSVRVWPVSPGSRDRTTGNDSKITAMALTPDGQGLIVACVDGTVKRWELPLAGPPRVLAATPTSLFALAVARDGRWAAGGYDGVIRLYTADGQPLRELSYHQRNVRSIAWSPDGSVLASGSENGRLGLWSTEHFTPLPKPETRGPVLYVEFSQDGRLLAVTCQDKQVLLWDRQQDRVIASQVCHAKSVLFARFRPGSPQLATGGLDYLVKLWHLPDLTLRYTLPGHSNSVFASAFTPDGRSLVTGSGNRFENVPGDVRIWDVETGHLRATLLGQTGPIAMSSDGAMLATVEEFTAVRLWRVDPPR